MTNQSDDIEWGLWFLGNGKPPYKYKPGEPVEGPVDSSYSYSADLCTVKLRNILWRDGRLYRMAANHPHYTPEGQLYYLKQQFPNVKWVQALEATPVVDPVVLRAEQVYKQMEINGEFLCGLSTQDYVRVMRCLIKGIKAGMEMVK